MNNEENCKKEEWGCWKIVSDMLDNPDEIGIYPTSECYQKLYEFVVEQKAQATKSEKERNLNIILQFQGELESLLKGDPIKVGGVITCINLRNRLR